MIEPQSCDWSIVSRVFEFEEDARLCHLYEINEKSPNTDCCSSNECATTRKCSLLVVADESAGCFVSVLETFQQKRSSPTSDSLQHGSNEWSELTRALTPDELQGWWLSSALLPPGSFLLSCEGSCVAFRDGEAEALLSC